jgi:hypothetical protein
VKSIVDLNALILPGVGLADLRVAGNDLDGAAIETIVVFDPSRVDSGRWSLPQ